MMAALPAAQHRSRVPSVLVPLVGAAGVAATAVAALPTICPFRICTGHACPGCGLTRGVVAALKGDVGLSVRYHPLAMVIALQLLIGWVVYLKVGSLRWHALLRRALPLILANVAVALVVWAVRWQQGLLDFVV